MTESEMGKRAFLLLGFATGLTLAIFASFNVKIPEEAWRPADSSRSQILNASLSEIDSGKSELLSNATSEISESVSVSSKRRPVSIKASSKTTIPQPNQLVPNETVSAHPAPAKRVFVCGYRGSERTASALFPDYKQEVLTEATNVTESDILCTAGLAPTPLCPFKVRGRGMYVFKDWINQNFKGKALFHNAESTYDTRGENTFDIGYLPDSNRSIRVYFGIKTLVEYGPKEWQKLFAHEQKPVNTGQNFLIYAVSNCVSFREAAVDALAEINQVSQGGRCWGIQKDRSKVHLLPDFPDRTTSYELNRELFHDYRFCLVMENAAVEGYITEKIINAFLAGCIPIYYGTREIFDVFNEKAFVFYDIDNPQAALEKVKVLESNRTAYEQVLAETVLANGEKTINRYFSISDEIGDGSLKRRIRQMMGLPSR